MESIPNAPEGMKFYVVSPSIGQFSSVIGVSDEKIYLGGTQSQIPSYKDALKLVKNTIRKKSMINIKTLMSLSK